MAVQAALSHALSLWKNISPKQYPNGAVVFCSEEFSESLHPPTPLKGRLYNCGSHFATEIVRDAINAQLGPVYGLIVIDGSDAAFGKVQGLSASLASGPVVSELGSLNGNIAGRTRRGGQSALRYSRNREGEELAFLRKVSERALTLFADVQGVVLGGKADMKLKLVQELPESLRSVVLCTVDLACDVGPEALRQAALRAAGCATSFGNSETERALNYFFELTIKDSMCCYGEGMTLKALQMGAVEHLLIAEQAVAETQTTLDVWKAMAAAYGTSVVEIHPGTEQGSKFCKSFIVGGCLRWPLDLEMLEQSDAEDHADDAKETKPFEDQGQDETNGTSSKCNDSESVLACVPGPAPLPDIQCAHMETLQWFEVELKDVFDDPSSAEALVACVEVLLTDDATPRDEVEEGVLALLSSECVPQELALELISRW